MFFISLKERFKMINFNENSGIRIPFKLRKQVKKAKETLIKSGCNEVEVRKSKNGTIGVLGYKTPDHDTIEFSRVINPDGKAISKTYREFIPQNADELKSKIIVTCDMDKDDYIFNKRTVIQFKDSKFPEVISTMYSDSNSDDGVKIVTKYPHKEYLEKYSSEK